MVGDRGWGCKWRMSHAAGSIFRGGSAGRGVEHIKGLYPYEVADVACQEYQAMFKGCRTD